MAFQERAGIFGDLVGVFDDNQSTLGEYRLRLPRLKIRQNLISIAIDLSLPLHESTLAQDVANRNAYRRGPVAHPLRLYPVRPESTLAPDASKMMDLSKPHDRNPIAD